VTPPKGKAAIKSVIDGMMAQRKDHPYFDYATQIIEKAQYNHIYDLVHHWTLEPLSPATELDYKAFSKLEDEDEDEDIENDIGIDEERRTCYGSETDHKFGKHEQPLMSYNDRMAETKTIIDIFGGPDRVKGYLCLKVPSDTHIDIMSILDIIKDKDLSYCVPLGLDGVHCVKQDGKKIIVLDYDA
jgi:hypothetical protein